MADPLNRRVHPRSLTDERASAFFDGRKTDCVVRDRSRGGARLVFKGHKVLPARFELQRAGVSQFVEVIWTDGLQAGVRFCER